MASPFDDEIDAGFAELASVTGTAADGTVLKFKGVTVPGGGVLSTADDERTRVDTKLGSIKRCHLMVARSSVAALQAKPKVGDAFELGARKLRIEDIIDEDPTDRTVVYVVKVSG